MVKESIVFIARHQAMRMGILCSQDKDSFRDGILKTTENIGDHWQWRVGEMNEGYQKVQASCYKINKPWGYSMCSMVTVVNSTGLYI